MIGSKNQCINWLLEQDDGKFKIDVYKEKRNKKQNDKYWELINQLSRKIKISVSEIHFNMLKTYSPRYEILVPENTELRGVEYYEKKSKIKKGDKYFIVYHVYTPSHELKTDEFAILLQGLIEECQSQDIETRSPSQILMEENFYEI